MIKIALTGSIAMGKSTVAKMFAAAGLPVFDADAEVHRLQGPGGALVPLIERRFPGSTRHDSVDRDALALHVLGQPERLKDLEAIVHPAVEQARKHFMAAHADSPAMLFDIPLLFETGMRDRFDHVVLVTAPADVQRARALTRPGMTPGKLDAILEQQLPDKEKRPLADFIVDTAVDLSTTEKQVRDILACLGLGRNR